MNKIKLLISLLFIWWFSISSISFWWNVCPWNNEIFTQWNYELKLVEVENNNSNFIKKVLEEIKTNLSSLNVKKNAISTELEALTRAINEWTYWELIKTNETYLAKKALLEWYLNEYNTKYTTFNNQYISIDYVWKLRSWDNDEYVETPTVYLQTNDELITNNISCIKFSLLTDIETDYKKIEMQLTIAETIMNELKILITTSKDEITNQTNIETHFDELLWTVSTSWIVWWWEINNSEFIKLDKDWKNYINTIIELNWTTWKTYLEWLISSWLSDIKLIWSIPSTTTIWQDTYNIIKNQHWTSYWYLKYKINVFNNCTLTNWSQTINLSKWTWYLILWYDTETITWKISYYDDKWREQDTKEFSLTNDIEFSDYVWISQFNWRIISENLSDEFKTQVMWYVSSIWSENLNVNWKIVPILTQSTESYSEINSSLIDVQSNVTTNSILNNWKVSSKVQTNNWVKYNINISPSLLRYFKDWAFDSIDDIAKLVNINWTIDDLQDSESKDEFIELLTKSFEWQTILWWTWTLNTWSLYNDTTWNRVILQRNISTWWITLDWSLREYWFINPNYQWDNNWKAYARWMLVVIWKMISLEKDWEWNVTWWNIYLFPLIDQDRWTVLNIWNITKSFYETSKLSQCWKSSYTCWDVTLETWQEYQQQHITNFTTQTSKNLWKSWCSITQEELDCIMKKIDSPTTIMIWDNRKWLQDIIMMKFTLDMTQTRIEDAISYKFITSVPQYWNRILKIRRWKKDWSWNPIVYYVKSIQNEAEMNNMKSKFNWKFLTNLIVTTKQSDFDSTNADDSKRDRIKSSTWLLTKEQLIEFFGIWQL